ncbi:hopanoid biosynthesis-associated protein HpnK [Sphingomonas sp. CL5.1]|uniref:hopanoid biosynthesis-associated protein HpnK n=1 Tax=Sphingomonas sp. CL5.1 TaxID=2653203 RepID=UPI001581CA05|nr:hopanoid biosynthesis-associated protein HpnK [Sphingomonas sp. CL5.1]QKR99672.1 hopanoid biosynthesis-associated protein HpnK [Sphingomonas sp. CL5.1]
MRRLIVTADDFGASPEVNDAVEQAHRGGILTAASLMVAGDAAADAVERARRLSTLGVGLHVVLVEGRPVLPPERLPALVDAAGMFRTDMARAGLTIFAAPAARRQLRAEIEAQFAAFAATGLPLDHVNAHKHFHLHPTIAGTILAVGRQYGMKAVRAPVEPAAPLHAIDGTRTGPRIETAWAKLVRRRMRRAGMVVPDQVFGLAWSGAMTAGRVRSLLDRLPDGLSELYTHPATAPWPGGAPGYDYPGELAALTDALAQAAIARNSIALGRFADFT